ncbi:serine/threonine-protein kinase [Tahibacter sp. UC22_41]|uniref:serine/threonine-protein kinase n=1 Tax=Tahibacter sp. UC22_41 TaxID=3350178 RepID=UPI0036DB1EA4
MNDTADRSQWLAMQRIFDEALALPPAERDAYVDAAAENEDMAATLRRLLVAHDEYPATQDIVRSSHTLALALGTFARHRPLQPGTELGESYRIDALLGSGGMGSVYLATRTVGGSTQRVALKIAPPGLDHARIVEHLRGERTILARLDHPNIARLIDAGELPDGRPYFAMEYVDGVRITDYCDEHRLTLPARLALFATVCDAVAYAHRRFVLHRDLKPGNILVDRDGRVRLLDFGIAKAIDEAGVTDATVDSGFFSPDCAAPEQVAGQATGIATDVYGLGCLLYRLLCGTGVFDFSGKSRAAVIDDILHEEPLPPSRAVERGGGWVNRGQADAASLTAALRGDLDLITAKALRKPPDDRYGSVDALAEDVRNVLAARPIGLRARERGYRLRCFVRRHRVAVTATALAAIVAVTALVLILVQSSHIAAARAVAERERDHARGVSEFLVNAFGDAAAFRTRSREVSASELLENAARQLHSVPAADAELTAAVGQTLAQLYLRLDMKEPARAQALLAREALARLPRASTLLRVRQAGVDAELAGNDGRLREARAAIAAAETAMAADPDFRDADAELGIAMLKAHVTRLSGDPFGAIAHLRSSLERFRPRADVPPIRLEPMQQVLARQLALNGDPVEALSLLDPLLAEQRRRLPDDDKAVIETLRSLGQAYYRLRRNDDAAAAYEQAIAGFRKHYGDNYTDMATMLVMLGRVYAEAGRTAESERLLREALRIAVSREKNRHQLANMYGQLANLYSESYHDYAAALRFIGLAYAVMPAEARDARAYNGRILAETLIANGDWFEAMLHAEGALPFMVDSCVDCQQIAYLRGDIAYARFRLYDLAGAREWLTRDTLTTLRVWSRWPHNVRMRAEEVARTAGTAEDAAVN